MKLFVNGTLLSDDESAIRNTILVLDLNLVYSRAIEIECTQAEIDSDAVGFNTPEFQALPARDLIIERVTIKVAT